MASLLISTWCLLWISAFTHNSSSKSTNRQPVLIQAMQCCEYANTQTVLVIHSKYSTLDSFLGHCCYSVSKYFCPIFLSLEGAVFGRHLSQPTYVRWNFQKEIGFQDSILKLDRGSRSQAAPGTGVKEKGIFLPNVFEIRTGRSLCISSYL